MRCYKCKVKIVRDWEVTVYAKNKKEAAEEAPSLCTVGWGFLIKTHTEVTEIEHMAAKRKKVNND